jgi:hypothetical protein
MEARDLRREARTAQIAHLHWRREQEFSDLCTELTENHVLRRCLCSSRRASSPCCCI